MLSQIDVANKVFDLNVVNVYWCVVFHHHLCLRLVHLQTDFHFLQLIPVACGVLAHISLSSAKRR